MQQSRIETALDRWLAEGRRTMGQVAIEPEAAGGFVLRHRDDAGRMGLEPSSDPEAAAAISLFDDAGEYRPLKTAPNLRHGWRLRLAGLSDLYRALDLLYPARLAVFLAWEEERLLVTNLRATLARQSGMYRVAGKMTAVQSNDLVGRFCRSEGGCLRAILWKWDDAGESPASELPPVKFEPLHDQSGGGARVIPLLCQEACNLLVAEARQVVKKGA